MEVGYAIRKVYRFGKGYRAKCSIVTTSYSMLIDDIRNFGKYFTLIDGLIFRKYIHVSKINKHLDIY